MGGFDVATATASMRTSSVRAGIATGSAQVLGVMLQITSTIVLARFISSEAYGTVGMATTATMFAALFKDLGLTSATIQRESLSASQQSFLFWLNVAFAATVTLVLAAFAPAVSAFYGNPRLTPITLVLAFNLLLGSCGAQHAALLSREMRFREVAAAHVTGLIAQFLVTLVLAMLGLQAWAIVWGFLTYTAVHTGLVWALSGWRPGFPRPVAAAGELVHFGASLTLYDFVNYFARNLDNILIGRVWGAEQLGYYSRAYSLVLFPIYNIRGPLLVIALPALSRLQRDPAAFRRYYRRALGFLALVTMPIASFCVAQSALVIETLLGSEWQQTVPIARWLAVVSFLQPSFGLFGAVLVAKGMVKRHLAYGLLGAVITSVSFVVSVSFGSVALAQCYAVAQYVLFIPLFVYASRGTDITLADFFRAVFRPAIAAVAAAVGVAGMPPDWPPGCPVLQLLASAALFVAVYFGVYMLLPGGAGELAYYRNAIREALACRRPAPAA